MNAIIGNVIGITALSDEQVNLTKLTESEASELMSAKNYHQRIGPTGIVTVKKFTGAQHVIYLGKNIYLCFLEYVFNRDEPHEKRLSCSKFFIPKYTHWSRSCEDYCPMTGEAACNSDIKSPGGRWTSKNKPLCFNNNYRKIKEEHSIIRDQVLYKCPRYDATKVSLKFAEDIEFIDLVEKVATNALV